MQSPLGQPQARIEAVPNCINSPKKETTLV